MTTRYDQAVELLQDALATFRMANKDAFKNGVTDSSGTMDEGDVRSGEVYSAIHQFLQEEGKL